MNYFVIFENALLKLAQNSLFFFFIVSSNLLVLNLDFFVLNADEKYFLFRYFLRERNINFKVYDPEKIFWSFLNIFWNLNSHKFSIKCKNIDSRFHENFATFYSIDQKKLYVQSCAWVVKQIGILIITFFFCVYYTI